MSEAVAPAIAITEKSILSQRVAIAVQIAFDCLSICLR